MDDKLTDEEAKKIAEWLGFKRYVNPNTNAVNHKEYWVDPDGEYVALTGVRFGMWLDSAEGERALMDRLLQGPEWIGVEIYIPPDEELQGQAFSVTLRSVWQTEIIQCGRTRHRALQRAILEMIGGKS